MTTYSSALANAVTAKLQIVFIIEGTGATDESWIEAIHLSKDEALKHAAQLKAQHGTVSFYVTDWPMLASAPPTD